MTLKEKAKQKHSFKRYILLVIMRGLWCRPQGRPDCLVFKLPEHSTHSLSPCGEHGLLMWAASGPHSNSFLSTGYRSHRRLTPDAGYHTTGLGVECKWTHTQLACYQNSVGRNVEQTTLADTLNNNLICDEEGTSNHWALWTGCVLPKFPCVRPNYLENLQEEFEVK